MKDKLEKTGHKRSFYKTRMFAVIFALIISLFALAAIPVGITYKLSAAKGNNSQSTSLNVTPSN